MKAKIHLLLIVAAMINCIACAKSENNLENQDPENPSTGTPVETNSPNNNWVTISEESFPSERTGETLTIQYPCRTDIR